MVRRREEEGVIKQGIVLEETDMLALISLKYLPQSSSSSLRRRDDLHKKLAQCPFSLILDRISEFLTQGDLDYATWPTLVLLLSRERDRDTQED